MSLKGWIGLLVMVGTIAWVTMDDIRASSNKLNLNQQALQPITNSAVFATHNQIQQASDLRCASQNGTRAYSCTPCPPTGACNTGIPPNPCIAAVVYGMELQFIADVPCSTPGACSLNVCNTGLLSFFVNNGGSTPAIFGAGFHRIAADLIGTQLVWRVLY